MNIVIAFYQYEVVTKIKVIDEVDTNFPTVYFCVDKEAKEAYPFSCQFNSSEDFSYLVEKMYANNKCYVFNSGKNIQGHTIEPLKLKEVGNNYGLRILLYLKKSGDVKIFIGDHLVLPKVNELGRINVRNGYETNIFLTKVSVKNLPHPYNNCQDNLNLQTAFDSDLYRKTLKNSYKYRQDNCFDICACQELSSVCNCTCPGIHETSYDNNCYDNDCFNKKLKFYDYVKSCSTFCPKECHSVSFSSTSSSFLYFQSITNDDKEKFKKYAKLNGISLSGINPTDNVEYKGLAINLYLNDMKYTEISELAKMAGIDLVSNIGGCLGLFMGLSLLSLIEILEFFIEIIYLIGEPFKPRKRLVEGF
jgi:hypothetical protein